MFAQIQTRKVFLIFFLLSFGNIYLTLCKMASVYVIMGAVSTPALHAPTWITRDELEVSYSYGGANSGIEPVWVDPRTLGGVKRVDVMQQLSLGDTSHENKAERKIIAFFPQ